MNTSPKRKRVNQFQSKKPSSGASKSSDIESTVPRIVPSFRLGLLVSTAPE